MEAATARIRSSDEASYDAYVRAEWALSAADPGRTREARDLAAKLPAARVLDIGCGAGQELRPFASAPRLAIGVDVSPEAGRAGRELFAAEEPGSRTAFARARAEALPFPSHSFDVVICRLALPYTDNAQTLSEIARVLRPGGVLLLKYHHARYYLDELREALGLGRMKPLVHACRVLLAGSWYHVTRRQPRGRLAGSETFQTAWLLRREFRRRGLEVERRLSDSVPAAPSLLVRKR